MNFPTWYHSSSEAPEIPVDSRSDETMDIDESLAGLGGDRVTCTECLCNGGLGWSVWHSCAGFNFADVMTAIDEAPALNIGCELRTSDATGLALTFKDRCILLTTEMGETLIDNSSSSSEMQITSKLLFRAAIFGSHCWDWFYSEKDDGEAYCTVSLSPFQVALELD